MVRFACRHETKFLWRLLPSPIFSTQYGLKCGHGEWSNFLTLQKKSPTCGQMIMLVYACFLVFHDVSWFLESFQRSILWVIGRCNKILSMQNLKLEKWMLSTTDFQDACHCKEQNKRKCMNMTCQILYWNISGELKAEVWSCQVSLSCLQVSFQHAWEDFISKLRVAQQLQQIWKTKKQTMRWCHCRETTKSCWTRNWWQSISWVSMIFKFLPMLKDVSPVWSLMSCFLSNPIPACDVELDLQAVDEFMVLAKTNAEHMSRFCFTLFGHVHK